MEVELELRNSTNASTVAVAKITRERGRRVDKKCLCVVFWLTRRSRVCVCVCGGGGGGGAF